MPCLVFYINMKRYSIAQDATLRQLWTVKSYIIFPYYPLSHMATVHLIEFFFSWFRNDTSLDNWFQLQDRPSPWWRNVPERKILLHNACLNKAFQSLHLPGSKENSQYPDTMVEIHKEGWLLPASLHHSVEFNVVCFGHYSSAQWYTVLNPSGSLLLRISQSSSTHLYG